MPRYRAKALLFVDRLIHPGEEFSSEAPPGINWEPLDSAATQAVASRFPSGAPDVVMPGGVAPTLLRIPDDWREFAPQRIISMAVKLGAPRKGTRLEAAVKHIERELALRGLTSPERAREAA